MTFALVGWLQAVPLPPVEDVVRWGFYGIGGWIALNTWGNGKKLSRLCEIIEGESGLAPRLKTLEKAHNDLAEGIEERMTASRHAVAGRIQGTLSDMETRLTDRVERVENKLFRSS